MALVLKDRVLETCTSPGTGSVSLLGAVAGYQAFSAGVGNSNTCYYTIADQSGANWEVGIGTYNTAGNILVRTTILASSNSNTTVNFNAGTQNVFVTYPAEKAVYLDASGVLQPTTAFTALFASPPALGNTTANTGAFTTLSATGVITYNTTTNNQSYTTTGAGTITLSSGATGTINGFNIGNTTAGTGAFTTLSATGSITINTTTNNQSYTTTGAGSITITSATTGSINGFNIGGTTAGTGAFTTLTASADSSFTSTGALLISKGTAAQQPGTPVTGMIRYNTTSNQFEGYVGSSPSWLPVGTSGITNDTSTVTNVYPLFANATSGSATTVYTSNANYLYKPSTGELQAQAVISANGITVNANTISTSYTIAAANNGISAGPVSVASGATVTVSTGSTWVIA